MGLPDRGGSSRLDPPRQAAWDLKSIPAHEAFNLTHQHTGHTHGESGGGDHELHDDHGHDDHFDLDIGGQSEDIEGIEMFTINSVGIDIGSSTSHLIFSRLTLRREGAAFSSRFRVAQRQVLYSSPIMLTPYVSGVLIDTERIRGFVQQAYDQAGFTPDAIDTGAVVITGEALKKENAQPIAELFAQEAGKFICASAGPNHEALLAAYGCGAVALSESESATVLNIDIGGGTTKFSLIRNGAVVSTAALSVGARLIAFDASGMIERLEEPGVVLLRELGHPIPLGGNITEPQKDAVANLMADLVLEVVQAQVLSPLAHGFMLTEPLSGFQGPPEIDFIVFSGGVSEYVYNHESGAFGDLGSQFGGHIRQKFAGLFEKGVVRESSNGIRATVIGAGEYTIQASGSTSHLSGAASLPVFGLKVVRPNADSGDSLEQSLLSALANFDLTCFSEGLALALTVEQPPDYQSLLRLANGVASIVTNTEAAMAPVFIVVDTDVAKSLGGILKEELGLPHDVVVVDGIDVGDLDYIDIGRPMGVSEVVPVTVKSLVFPNQG
jgi:ethanolamine utilization protein EutA